MDADVERSHIPQAEGVRLHVRKLLTNFVQQQKRKRSEVITRTIKELKELAHNAHALPISGALDRAGMLGALPIAVYATDVAGFITFYNEAAAALWGRHPVLGVDRWCGASRVFRSDGTLLPHDERPLVQVLQEGCETTEGEAMMERSDGTCIPFRALATPLRDASGGLVGAVSVLVDLRTAAALGPADQWHGRF